MKKAEDKRIEYKTIMPHWARNEFPFKIAKKSKEIRTFLITFLSNASSKMRGRRIDDRPQKMLKFPPKNAPTGLPGKEMPSVLLLSNQLNENIFPILSQGQLC